MAKVASDFNEETFPYWFQSGKWRGHFKIEWQFIKDISKRHFDNFKNGYGMPVIRSKDGTPLEWEIAGKAMMNIFK